MSEDIQHRMRVVVAGEEIVFRVAESEEVGFRKAAHSVNEMWNSLRASQPGKSSHYTLAKVALAFAELTYHKTEQLKNQAALIDKLEKDIDNILLKVD